MVKKLRNKFVVITTALLGSLFGIFLIVNAVYNRYWNEIEIVEMLDWIAYSGIFVNYDDRTTSEEDLIRDITKDESPIAGIIMNKEGNILSSRVIGKDTMMEIPGTVLEKMYENKGNKKRINKYYYSYTELNEETFLLVIMNSALDKFTGGKILGISILILGGITLLEIIIFWLSKFVTKPAEQTLLREKQFISDAGHELKTPLGAISINAQVLESEYGDNLYIKNILSESQRMGRLLEKLLVLAKFDEQENVDLWKFNLSEVCEEMALTYESLAFEKKIEFEYEIKTDLEIVGNEDEIRQLLAILIDNAIKNTEENGYVLLKCDATRRYNEISVTNTGPGISEEIIPHVFERFYTSDQSRTSGSFGLGLSIAKSIVDRHKGVIKLESIPGEKTTFQVML